MTYVVRDYGSPVSLGAAECQFAVLDGEDGAPVAYVYSREDALRCAASADLLEALQLARQHMVNEGSAIAEICDAALARATPPTEGSEK